MSSAGPTTPPSGSFFAAARSFSHFACDLGAGVAEVEGGVVLGDPRPPVLPAALEGDVLVQVGLVPDLLPRRVDHAVDDHAAHVGREERAVDGAEVGAVGDAEVVELLLAERGADDVQVARGVRRGHVRQHASPLRSAQPSAYSRGQLALGALVGLGVGDRVGLGRLDELLRVDAGDGRGVADAARVEAHEVVRLGRVRPERVLGGDPGREAHAGAAGAAGVVDEGALALRRACRCCRCGRRRA